MNKIQTTNREFLQETIALKEKIELAFLDLGKRLMKIRDEKLYDGDYANFEEYLIELDMSKGTASKLIAIYQKFIVEYGMNPNQLSKVPWTSLYQLLKIADSKDRAEELVHNAGISKMGYIEKEVREHEHPNCYHDWKDIHIRQCTKCALREKLYQE